MDRIDIDKGKYSIVVGNDNDKCTWTFKALRYGEDWIEDLYKVDCSNLILAMAYEIQRLKNQLETIKELDDTLIDLKFATD